MPLRMLKDGQKRLAYRKPNTGPFEQEYEYFNVLRESEHLSEYLRAIKNSEDK